ncbi:MAG TPA: alpha/beta fold hydrolase [Chitinophagales bacterium]|nr:alpha/beta fold hydrolase [Chitinophagales bacterium]HRK26175.1 alpha/beta fold hydrolase [Chitinophagales bacterium]
MAINLHIPLPIHLKTSGKAVILLHGFCEDGLMWQHFAQELSNHYTVIAPDLPGFGSAPPLPGITLPNMAAAVRATLQNLDINQYVVVGHSMGGYVALEMANQQPDALLGIMLFHSTAFADDETKRAGREAAINSIQQYGARPFLTHFFEALFTPRFALQQPDMVQAMKQRAAQLLPQTLTDVLQAMKQRPDYTHQLADFNFPVGFIAGAADTFVPWQKTLAECHLPKVSSLHILPDVGHAGMLEQPLQTLGMVKAFTDLCFLLA